MKTITIGLSRHIGFNIISLGIRLFQKTTYSHAYIKIHIPEIDRTAVFQATGIGVNFTSLEVFNSKDIKDLITPASLIPTLYTYAYENYYNGNRQYCLDILAKTLKDKYLVDEQFKAFTFDGIFINQFLINFNVYSGGLRRLTTFCYIVLSISVHFSCGRLIITPVHINTKRNYRS